jgi:hypothetical protein
MAAPPPCRSSRTSWRCSRRSRSARTRRWGPTALHTLHDPSSTSYHTFQRYLLRESVSLLLKRQCDRTLCYTRFTNLIRGILFVTPFAEVTARTPRAAQAVADAPESIFVYPIGPGPLRAGYAALAFSIVLVNRLAMARFYERTGRVTAISGPGSDGRGGAAAGRAGLGRRGRAEPRAAMPFPRPRPPACFSNGEPRMEYFFRKYSCIQGGLGNQARRIETPKSQLASIATEHKHKRTIFA